MDLKTKDLTHISLFTTLISICSWISIPAAIPFTLQTFAIFLTIGLLGGKRGSIAVLVYILLGAVGLPVFANFQGGIGILLGPTGGYIIGFLASALVMWAIMDFFGDGNRILAISMVIGLVICYIFGTAWFIYVYTNSNGPVSLMEVLAWCVIPFLIPDIIKISLSLILVNKLKKHIKLKLAN